MRAQQRHLVVVGNSVMYSEPERLPFAIRMTTEQVLQAADDADLRAEFLNDVARLTQGHDDSFTRRDAKDAGVDRRVKSLHEAASDLREVAAHLVDPWHAPRETS